MPINPDAVGAKSDPARRSWARRCSAGAAFITAMGVPSQYSSSTLRLAISARSDP